MTQDNNIDVFFTGSTFLTVISPALKEQLYKALSDENSLSEKSCIEQFSLNYKETIGLNHSKRCTLTVQPLWVSGTKKTIACEKMQNLYTMATMNDRMRVCAENLRAGKCQDPLMRRTLGALLFPQLYANEKQK